MKISIIVAISSNNAIGRNNDLLWHLPKDMKFFKEQTAGHCVITGRKNYFSIPEKFRPLPNRTNIVVTRNKQLDANGAIITDSIQSALKIAEGKGESEAFIIGGGEIYKQSLEYADKIYLTKVDAIFEDADTFFPEIDYSKYNETLIEKHKKDEKHKYDFDILVLEKIK